MIHVGFLGGNTGHVVPIAHTFFLWLVALRRRHKRIVLHHAGLTDSDLDVHKQARSLGIDRIIHAGPVTRLDAYMDALCSYSITTTTTVKSYFTPFDALADLVEQTTILLVSPLQGRGLDAIQALNAAQTMKRRVIEVDWDGSWDERG